MKGYYKLFDEVIFFPSFRKMRIIECVPMTLNKIKQKENEENS